MKKLLLLFIVPFLSFGQDLTYVPDDGFEYWIENNIDGASNGDINDDYVFTDALQNNTNSVSITQTIPIYDLTGIEDFRITSISLSDLYVSEIDLSAIEFSVDEVGFIDISYNQYLESIILPEVGTFDRIRILAGQPLLETVEFHDGLVFKHFQVVGDNICEIEIKGQVSEAGYIAADDENFKINAQGLEQINFSGLSNIPFNTSIGFGYTPNLKYINLNNSIPLYNWTMFFGFTLIANGNVCVEVNDPAFCNENNDWPQNEEITYSNYCNVNTNCSNTYIAEATNEKNLITTIDILGREATNKGFQLHIYDDGTVEKKYLIK